MSEQLKPIVIHHGETKADSFALEVWIPPACSNKSAGWAIPGGAMISNEAEARRVGNEIWKNRNRVKVRRVVL